MNAMKSLGRVSFLLLCLPLLQACLFDVDSDYGINYSINSAGAVDMTPYLGEWEADAPRCGANATEGRFIIERSQIRYYEAICRIDGVRSVRVGTAVALDMECEGEGEQWRTSALLALLDEAKLAFYYNDGGGFVAARCRR